MKNQEKQLIKGILEADERCLFSFYQRFSPKLLLFIKQRVKDPEDAEEILQDTLLSSLDSLRDFNFQAKLSTFLCAIAKNKIIDFQRKKKIKKILFSQAPQLEFLLANLLGPEEVFEEKQLRKKIEKALSSLPLKYQKILKLKYFDGKSVIQITQELKISFKSAESALFRARKAFAKQLSIL